MGKGVKDKGVLIFDVLIFSENPFLAFFKSAKNDRAALYYIVVLRITTTNVLMTIQYVSLYDCVCYQYIVLKKNRNSYSISFLFCLVKVI